MFSSRFIVCFQLPSFDNPFLNKKIAFGRYQRYPFAINSSTFMEWDDTGSRIQNAASLENEKIENVASVNGVPYGIRSDGEILQIHHGEQIVSIFLSTAEKKCHCCKIMAHQ